MIPLCRDQEVALVPWSGLARGFLAGTRRPTVPAAERTVRAKSDEVAVKYYGHEGDRRVLDASSALAVERGIGNAVLAYAWLLNKGMTALAIGAMRVEHVEQAVTAVDYRLLEEEIADLEIEYEPHPVIGY